ncbi:MAG: efflux RND transporter periplasmic adaptor subunit, partial [Chloroflexi bacterium]|nr:efflux RND transporter periplasmic adaptor subunit [Chloroflexota bacterium]
EQAKLAVQNAQEQLALTKQPYTAQDVEQAQAAVDQVKAAYDQAEQNLKDTTVTAPISGVITEKSVSRGVLVGPNTTLVTIASPEDDVEINVPETEIAGMVAGKPVTINAQTAGVTGSLKGKVTNVAPSADAKSRAFLVKVAPDTATAPLLPGTFATVTITPEEHANVLAVPSDSIVQRGGKSTVFVVQNGMAKQVPVSVGLSNGTLTEIVSGVQPGWEVVTQGQDTLVDGDHVTVAKTSG